MNSMQAANGKINDSSKASETTAKRDHGYYSGSKERFQKWEKKFQRENEHDGVRNFHHKATIFSSVTKSEKKKADYINKTVRAWDRNKRNIGHWDVIPTSGFFQKYHLPSTAGMIRDEKKSKTFKSRQYKDYEKCSPRSRKTHLRYSCRSESHTGYNKKPSTLWQNDRLSEDINKSIPKRSYSKFDRFEKSSDDDSSEDSEVEEEKNKVNDGWSTISEEGEIHTEDKDADNKLKN